MTLADTAALVSSLELKDKFTPTVNKYEKSLSRMESSTASFGKTASAIGGHVSQGLGNAVKNIERIAVVAGGLAIGGAAAAVKWAGDFQAQLNTINTVAMVTPTVLEGIGKGIRDIAKQTGLSLDDLTKGYYDLVSAGIPAAHAQAVLNDAVTLGIGGLATTAETVDLLTSAINSYGLTVPQAAKATDYFAQAVADGKVTASQIAATFADIAPLAKNSGISIKEIATAFAFLTAKGVPAAEVTTQMKRALIELLKPNKDLLALEKKFGENYATTAKKSGLNVALNDLVADAKKAGVPLTDLFARVEGLQYVLQTTGPNAAGFSAELGKMGASAGEAAKQMAERQQGLNFQLDRLKANVRDAGITIGSALLPPLADLAEAATKFIQGHEGDIKQFGHDLAQGFKDALAWAKTLNLSGIGDALKTAAGAAKTLVGAFMNAPQWLQTAVITGWGLNKLTGGAVQNIFGDIAKGIGGQFLQHGSSPANPLFVSMGGVGGVAGAAGGVLGTLGSVVMKVAIVGLAAQAAIEITKALGTDYQGPATDKLPLDQLSWPWGPRNTPKISLGPWEDILGGDSPWKGVVHVGGQLNGGGLNPTFPNAGNGYGGGNSAGGGGGIGMIGGGINQGLTTWAAQVTGDFAHMDTTSKLFTASIKDSTAALKAQAAVAKDKSWLKDLKTGIAARSAAKYGGTGLGAGAVSATYQRDVLGRAASIVKSTASSSDKLERMKALLAGAKDATTDTKRVLSADIKTLTSKVAHQKPPSVTVNVGVNTEVSANAVITKYKTSTAYGSPNPDHKHSGIYEP